MRWMSSAAEGSPSTARRGFAVATVVVLLLLLNMLAFGAMRSGSNESSVASLRVETLRALYACDAGLIITIGELARGEPLGEEGRLLDLEGATVAVSSRTDDDESEIVIEGRSGYGRRRVVVEVDGFE